MSYILKIYVRKVLGVDLILIFFTKENRLTRMRSRLLLFLIVSCLLLGNITATEHDNNLDTPFIPHPTQYSASVTTYFKIDFQETLNFIIDTGSNHFSIVQGAKPFFNSDEKFDVYYRKG